MEEYNFETITFLVLAILFLVILKNTFQYNWRKSIKVDDRCYIKEKGKRIYGVVSFADNRLGFYRVKTMQGEKNILNRNKLYQTIYGKGNSNNH